MQGLQDAPISGAHICAGQGAVDLAAKALQAQATRPAVCKALQAKGLGALALVGAQGLGPVARPVAEQQLGKTRVFEHGRLRAQGRGRQGEQALQAAAVRLGDKTAAVEHEFGVALGGSALQRGQRVQAILNGTRITVFMLTQGAQVVLAGVAIQRGAPGRGVIEHLDGEQDGTAVEVHGLEPGPRLAGRQFGRRRVQTAGEFVYRQIDQQARIDAEVRAQQFVAV